MLRKYFPLVRSWFLATGIGLLVAGILLGIVVTVWDTFIPFWLSCVFPVDRDRCRSCAMGGFAKGSPKCHLDIGDRYSCSQFLFAGRPLYHKLSRINYYPDVAWPVHRRGDLGVVETVPVRCYGKGTGSKPGNNNAAHEKMALGFSRVGESDPALLRVWLASCNLSIELAKNEGIYATAEEAVIAINSQGWGGAQVVKLEDVHAGPNSWDGSQPHVWFGSCRVYLDRVPKGFLRLGPYRILGW